MTSDQDLLILPTVPLCRGHETFGGLFSEGAAGLSSSTAEGGAAAVSDGASTAGASGENGLAAAGRVQTEVGAEPNLNELRAGDGLADLGYDVTHQTTASSKGIPDVRTADLFIEGVSDVDVYTPETLTQNSILRDIEKKADHGVGVFVQANISDADISSIVARMWGRVNGKSIRTLFFQKANGSILRFDRP